MPYKNNLLFHMKGIHALLPRFNAEANVNLKTFQLEVRGRNRYYHMVPQYSYRADRRMGYTPYLRDDVKGFVGWLPYFNKRWTLAIDKLAFKDFCSANGLPTPRYWTRAADGIRDFIVKQRSSSFGYGIRGPFKTVELSGQEGTLKDNEYYEEFVPGKIAKVWYWNDNPVCLEMRDMPAVFGNGKLSLYDLMLLQANSSGVPPEQGEVATFARYQGFSPDDVVPSGTMVLADFRYGSVLIPLTLENINSLAEHANTLLGRQLAEAGPMFWRAIPEDMRTSTLYTIDAIVDAENRAWFLEANCNPMVHPDNYFPMFESMFGPALTIPSTGIPAGALPGIQAAPMMPPPPPPPAMHPPVFPRRPI
jgi:hypothetical protein